MAEKKPYSPDFNLETILDTQITPLMGRVVAICQEHGIPMVATFCYAAGAGSTTGSGPDYCTTLNMRNDALPGLVCRMALIAMPHLKGHVTDATDDDAPDDDDCDRSDREALEDM
jgi:hypothetical protein